MILQDVLFFIFITFLMKVMKNNPPVGGKNHVNLMGMMGDVVTF